MKLHKITEDESIEDNRLTFGTTEANILAVPLKAGRKTNAHTQFARLLRQLWHNKILSTQPDDWETLNRTRAGLGPDIFFLYWDDTRAYIVDWEKGKKYWYSTGI